jgi:hypothetical protein
MQSKAEFFFFLALASNDLHLVIGPRMNDVFLSFVMQQQATTSYCFVVVVCSLHDEEGEVDLKTPETKQCVSLAT